MVTFNLFIIVALVAVLASVGLMAWMIDGGVSDKIKTYLQLGLFTMMAGVIGLFFMIEDDSEFQYSGVQKKQQVVKQQGNPMSGGPAKIQDGPMPEGDGGIGMAEPEEDDGDGDGDAGKTERDCPMCPELVSIKPGTALLGAPLRTKAGSIVTGPATRQFIGREYDIGKYEITVGQFSAFVKATGYEPASKCRIGKKFEATTFRSPGFSQQASYPVVCVSWTDAQRYTDWLSEQSGRKYRLPTEIEWEFAARAGTTAPYVTSHGKLSSEEINFDNPTGVTRGRTSPIGNYAANANGLHDVHGNVWELTSDCWSNVYATHAEKKADIGWDCSKRIVKGAAWFSPPKHLDLAMRAGVRSDMASNGIGFRVMREPKPLSSKNKGALKEAIANAPM